MDDSRTQRIRLTDLEQYHAETVGNPAALNLYAVGADDTAADTHPGFVRQRNEDSFACCTRPDGELAFAMVADGIGGQTHGDAASYLCARHMVKAWRKFSRHVNPSEASCEAFLYTEIEKANAGIYRYALDHQYESHMGTTIASILFVRKKIITAHAGDSRVYRLRDDMLEQLTRDHSLIEQLVESGELTKEEAATHPYAHVISKSIGTTPYADPELTTYDHRPGDRFLLCSDGLTLHVGNDEILAALAGACDAEQAVRTLMERCLQRGGEDNVTLVCLFA